MLGTSALLGICLLTGQTPEPTAMNDLSAQVAAAIDSFQRPWMPKERELDGVTVVLDAAGGGSDHPRFRVGDDFVLLTAGYLYHMLSRAGAKTIMLRVDDHPYSTTREHPHSATVTAMRKYGARIALRLTPACRLDDPAAVTITPIELGSAQDEKSAEELREALVGELPLEERRAFSIAEAGPDWAASNGPGEAYCEVFLYISTDHPRIIRRPELLARENAAQLCRGILAYSRNERSKVQAEKPKSDDEPYVRAIENHRELPTLARSIWPEGNLPKEKLGWFCEMYARLGITNRSLVCFKPKANAEEDAVVLRGATNVPALAEGLRDALAAVGFKSVRSEMESLPASDRLGVKPFGVCRIATAMTYAKPDERSVPQTQLLYGEPVFLLDKQGDRYLLLASDGYWGWVGVDAVEALDASAFNAYVDRLTAVVLQDLVIEKRRIPRGATVCVEVDSNGALALVGPEGLHAPLPRDAVRFEPAAEQAAADARVRAALDLLYTPYVFGGRSPLGLDCSGLVASVCQRTGLPAARDAAQQAYAGRLVATHWARENLRAGDIVFFINSSGKIYHTGVAIDRTHIVDSSPPAVQIGCITPGDRLYDERMDRDFFIAKRP